MIRAVSPRGGERALGPFAHGRRAGKMPALPGMRRKHREKLHHVRLLRVKKTIETVAMYAASIADSPASRLSKEEIAGT